MENQYPLDFAYAYGKPSQEAKFRTCNEDFIVEEKLGFELDGSGEHICVLVKKNGENTQWVADKLAHYFDIKNMDVGFCGMKDRHAVTTQWFSIYLPGYTKDVDWSDFIAQYELNIEVLTSTYHGRKLRKGAHKANSFEICLRDIDNTSELEERLEKIKSQGVPNYFGEQRFGREGNNLSIGDAWVKGDARLKNRNKRGLIMSSLRSYLFNLVISERIHDNCLFENIDGDVSDESGRPTAPLWGRGRSAAQAEALTVEQKALQAFTSWSDKLEHVGLNHERRSMLIVPQSFNWNYSEGKLSLKFELAPGQFATSILREVCLLNDQSKVDVR